MLAVCGDLLAPGATALPDAPKPERITGGAVVDGDGAACAVPPPSAVTPSVAIKLTQQTKIDRYLGCRNTIPPAMTPPQHGSTASANPGLQPTGRPSPTLPVRLAAAGQPKHRARATFSKFPAETLTALSPLVRWPAEANGLDRKGPHVSSAPAGPASSSRAAPCPSCARSGRGMRRRAVIHGHSR